MHKSCIYGSIGYAKLTGQSFVLGQETKFQEVPLHLGIQPFYDFSSPFRIYGTFGLSYIFAFQRNFSNFVDTQLHENNLGAFFNVGALYHFCDRFFIDLFGEVSTCEMRFHPHQDQVQQGNLVNVGGYAFGCGLGLFF